MKEGRPLISFEFFPPKLTTLQENLLTTATELAACQPSFFSVTYGAGGSTHDGTLQTVKTVREKTALNVAPHISCIGSTRAELIGLIKHYQTIGIKRLVALRGDLPSGMGSQTGELQFANELVALIREIAGNHFHVDVAAYPECHPQALNTQHDLVNLKKKISAGANSAITQYFYNADAYFYFIDECQRTGIDIPIVPGIMPITNYAKLMRFSESCGAEIPRWLSKRLENYADNLAAIQAFGIEVVHDLCERLLKGGAPGLHFYTLNHTEPTLSLVKLLKLQEANAKTTLSVDAVHISQPQIV